MNKEKVYILQKDLPDSKAGDEYIYIVPYGNNNNAAYYKNGNVCEGYWTCDKVEDNTDWFKLKEEVKPYVSNVKYDGHTYIFTLNMGTEQSKTITVERDRLAEILIAEDKNKLIIEGFSNTEKYYTEKEYIQGLEDAFNSASDKTGSIIGKAKYISGYSENIFEDKYRSFSDYMNWKTIIQPS